MAKVFDENKRPLDSDAQKDAEYLLSPKKPRLAGTLTLKFSKISAAAQSPTYGSEAAAGADLCSAEECVVPARGKYLLSTGIRVAVPTGHYGRVAPRSGLASKHFIDVGAGVVDEDYRGELKVLLFNFGDTDFKVSVGDRIAQFICERYTRVELKEVDSLDETKRSDGGFGSTGIASNIAA